MADRMNPVKSFYTAFHKSPSYERSGRGESVGMAVSMRRREGDGRIEPLDSVPVSVRRFFEIFERKSEEMKHVVVIGVGLV